MMDQCNVTNAIKNADDYFSARAFASAGDEDAKKAMVQGYYKNNVYRNKDEEKWAPIINTKLDLRPGTQNEVTFWNRDGERMTFDQAQRIHRPSVIALLKGSVWFAGRSFGFSLKVQQMVIFSDATSFDDLQITIPREPTACAIEFNPPGVNDEATPVAEEGEEEEAPETPPPKKKARKN